MAVVVGCVVARDSDLLASIFIEFARCRFSGLLCRFFVHPHGPVAAYSLSSAASARSLAASAYRGELANAPKYIDCGGGWW